MNTKLSELLFEEKNIHKVFEKKILKEEDESQSNLVMNNQQLNVVGKRISAILDKAFPSEDVIFQRIEDGELSKDDTAINFTGIKTLEKKTLQGMLVNTFSIKGDTDSPATQFDIDKYEKWGFIPFTIRTKSGEEVEGKNSAGQELTQLFLLPIPGFTTGDQSLIALHTELFKLQGKVEQGEVMLHAGVGDMLRHISIPADQEEELQKALRAEKNATINANRKKQ